MLVNSTLLLKCCHSHPQTLTHTSLDLFLSPASADEIWNSLLTPSISHSYKCHTRNSSFHDNPVSWKMLAMLGLENTEKCRQWKVLVVILYHECRMHTKPTVDLNTGCNTTKSCISTNSPTFSNTNTLYLAQHFSTIGSLIGRVLLTVWKVVKSSKIKLLPLLFLC